MSIPTVLGDGDSGCARLRKSLHLQRRSFGVALSAMPLDATHRVVRTDGQGRVHMPGIYKRYPKAKTHDGQGQYVDKGSGLLNKIGNARHTSGALDVNAVPAQERLRADVGKTTAGQAQANVISVALCVARPHARWTVDAAAHHPRPFFFWRAPAAPALCAPPRVAAASAAPSAAPAPQQPRCPAVPQTRPALRPVRPAGRPA
eukprot:gene10764-biopygen13877